MKKLTIVLSVISCVLISFTTLSQQNSYSSQHEQVYDEQASQPLSEAELAQMLAPIALYPDSLLTHILIASTYPIEIIEAHRWLQKNDNLNSVQIAQSIESFSWDASVKALVPFEQIISRLSEDLTWMQQLGDAFLQDETRVLESIQILRNYAREAGNLDKMENTQVSYENNNIIIEPVKKEIVYVPYYDTRMVYGHWYWRAYPPVYWRPYHHSYVSRYSPFYWHTGVHISFNYFFSTFHWHKRHVVVVSPHKSHHYRSRHAISRGGYAKRWAHKPVHRRGVAYKSQVTRQKYYGSKVKNNRLRKTTKYKQQQFKQRLSNNKYISDHKTMKSNKKRNNTVKPDKAKSLSARVNHKAVKAHKSPAQHRPSTANTKASKKTPRITSNSKHKQREKQPNYKLNRVDKSNSRANRKQNNKASSVQKHRSHSAKSRN